jgi:hypothetical protein
MTQAFNLSQIANRVNTSGQLNAATGLFNQVPVANGGTGLSTITSGAVLLGAGTAAMTVLAGTTPGLVLATSPTGWAATPNSAIGGGNYVMNAYTSPATWTKPATLKAVKITVVGAGGAGGAATGPGIPPSAAGGGGGAGGAAIRYLDATAIPGPISISAGAGTNSFGSIASATAGATGPAISSPGNPYIFTPGGSGGVGMPPSSSGTINMSGATGMRGGATLGGGNAIFGGAGANSIFGGAGALVVTVAGTTIAGQSATGYGSGGGGAVKANAPNSAGGSGMPGIVIVEEFY